MHHTIWQVITITHCPLIVFEVKVLYCSKYCKFLKWMSHLPHLVGVASHSSQPHSVHALYKKGILANWEQDERKWSHELIFHLRCPSPSEYVKAKAVTHHAYRQEGWRHENQERSLWKEYGELQQWRERENAVKMGGMWRMEKTVFWWSLSCRGEDSAENKFHVLQVGNRIEDTLEIMTPFTE